MSCAANATKGSVATQPQAARVGWGAQLVVWCVSTGAPLGFGVRGDTRVAGQTAGYFVGAAWACATAAV